MRITGSALVITRLSSVAMNIGSEVATTASQIGAVRRRPRVRATGVASGATGAAGAAGVEAGAVVVIACSYEGIE